MNLEQEIAKIAGLMGDQTRAAILVALMEGKALTAGELALRANISPQTASNHLKKLLEAHLIKLVYPTTRYHYYKISSPLVAKAIESLSLLLPDKKRPPRHEKFDPEICFASFFLLPIFINYELFSFIDGERATQEFNDSGILVYCPVGFYIPWLPCS